MTIQFAWAALIATLSVSAQAQSPGASDRISIVGSSTVYPFSTLVAEQITDLFLTGLRRTDAVT